MGMKMAQQGYCPQGSDSGASWNMSLPMGFCLLNSTEPADEAHKGAPFWLAYNSPLGQPCWLLDWSTSSLVARAAAGCGALGGRSLVKGVVVSLTPRRGRLPRKWLLLSSWPQLPNAKYFGDLWARASGESPR